MCFSNIPVVGSSINAFSALGIEERPHQSLTSQMLNEMKITEAMVWGLIQRHLHAWSSSVLLWHQLLRIPKWQPHCSTSTARLASWARPGETGPVHVMTEMPLNTDETLHTVCSVSSVRESYLAVPTVFSVSSDRWSVGWKGHSLVLHLLY